MTDSCAVLLSKYCNLQLCKCCLCTAWSCNEVCGHPHRHWCPEHMCLHGEALHGKTPASLTLTSRLSGPRAWHGRCDLWLSRRAVVARAQCAPATLYGPRGGRALGECLGREARQRRHAFPAENGPHAGLAARPWKSNAASPLTTRNQPYDGYHSTKKASLGQPPWPL